MGILDAPPNDWRATPLNQLLTSRDLPGVLAHYKSDDFTLADGSVVKRWADRTTFGNDLVASGSGSVTVKASGLNGKPTLVVPSGAYLLSTAFQNAALAGGQAWGQPYYGEQPFTFVAVVKLASSGIGGTLRTVIGSGSGTTLSRLFQGSGNAFMQVAGGNTSASNFGGPVLNDDAFHVIIGHFSPYEMWVMVDGVLVSTATSDVHNNVGTLSASSAVGATSISSSVTIPSGARIVIDTGASAEVVTTTGAPSGAGPFTIPVPPLLYAHASAAKVKSMGILSQLSLGANPDAGTNMLGGEFAEAMVIGGRMSTVIARDLHVALAQKWGLRTTVPAQVNVHWLDTTDSGSQSIRVFIPPTHKIGSTVKAVLVHHQQNGNQSITPDFFSYTFVHALVCQGYVVIASANHGIDGWSSPNAVTDVTNARTWINSNVATVTDTAEVGYSMGGSLAVAAAKTGALPDLRGVYLIDGAVNLWWMYNNGYRTSINNGFSITDSTLSGAVSAGATSLPTTGSFPTIGTKLAVGAGTANAEIVTTTGASNGSSVAVTACANSHSSADRVSDYGTKTSGYDPCAYTSGQLPQGIRWRAIASAADATVVKGNNTDVFMPIAQAAAALEYGTITHPDGHIGKGASVPLDVLDFVKRCFGDS